MIRADERFFLSMPEIIASWRIIDQVINFAKEKNLKPTIYEAGTAGPKAQHDLMKGTSFGWYNLEDTR